MALLSRKASASISSHGISPRRALPPLALALLVAACGSGDDEVSFGGGGASGSSAGGRGGASQGGSASGGGDAGTSQSGKGGTSSKGGSGGTSSKGGSGGTSSKGGAAGEDGEGGSDVGGSGGSGTAGKSGAGTAGKGGTAGTGGKGGTSAGTGGKGGTTAGTGGSAAGTGGNASAGAGGSGTAGAGNNGSAGVGGTSSAGAGGGNTAGAGGAESGGAAGAPPLPICGDGVINRPNEACDGSDFGAQPPVCPQGSTGTVVCSPTCQRDTSGCVAPVKCGNGKVDDGEACDNDNARCKACQISCNAGEMLFEGHCYGGTASLSWTEAEANCVGRGGHLVTIGGSAENKMVYDLAGGNANLPLASKIWIGLNDRKTEGSFAWVSGSTSGYRNFRDGEPNAATANEDCAAMYLQLGTWNDDECNKPFVGICEFNPQAP